MITLKEANFIKDLKKGKEGEEIFIKFFDENDVEIMDVRNDTEYQKKDIDFRIPLADGGIENYEVKFDKLGGKTGNIPIEIISNSKTGKHGWLFNSKADYICSIFPDPKGGYLLYFSNLIKLLKYWWFVVK